MERGDAEDRAGPRHRHLHGHLPAVRDLSADPPPAGPGLACGSAGSTQAGFSARELTDFRAACVFKVVQPQAGTEKERRYQEGRGGCQAPDG